WGLEGVLLLCVLTGRGYRRSGQVLLTAPLLPACVCCDCLHASCVVAVSIIIMVGLLTTCLGSSAGLRSSTLCSGLDVHLPHLFICPALPTLCSLIFCGGRCAHWARYTCCVSKQHIQDS
ncbi:unnamed protein product, partial [Ectocarpus sp. 12 AP-2014]